MIRWIVYLAGAVIAELLAIILAPVLPLFAKNTIGPVNNNSASAREPRLPDWLSWFQTPDNSLLGDTNWRASHSGGYLSQVGWLLRNRAYWFKWSVLSAPVDTRNIVVYGNTNINYHTKTFGVFKIVMGDYWQYKVVKLLPFGLCFIGNFGWLLDDENQKNALFMFSPRFKILK